MTPISKRDNTPDYKNNHVNKFGSTRDPMHTHTCYKWISRDNVAPVRLREASSRSCPLWEEPQKEILDIFSPRGFDFFCFRRFCNDEFLRIEQGIHSCRHPHLHMMLFNDLSFHHSCHVSYQRHLCNRTDFLHSFSLNMRLAFRVLTSMW